MSQPPGCEIRSKASSSNRGGDGDVAIGWLSDKTADLHALRRVVVPMMCQRCKNEATVHLTEPGKGQHAGVSSLPGLCPEGGSGAARIAAEPAARCGRSKFDRGQRRRAGRRASRDVCPDCGIKYMEFRAGGRLGCPQDYWVFSKGLHAAFTAVPRQPRATSARQPRRREGASERLRLRTRLREAIAVKIMRKPRGCETCCARRTHTHDS